MRSKLVQLVIFQIILQLSSSQRRIKNGVDVTQHKRFMAYLVKAPTSPKKYDAWLCGGAIVAPKFILTAAACVEDVQHMYAIAGYRKYVPANKIAEDQCTKLARKKVTQACVPKQYDFAYDKIEKWGYIDIAVVQVESPYKFDAPNPLPFCSWVPNQIDINYDPKYQEPGTDSVVFGWGHNLKWRQWNSLRTMVCNSALSWFKYVDRTESCGAAAQMNNEQLTAHNWIKVPSDVQSMPSDPVDYNQKHLQYAPLVLQSKSKCKDYFSKTPALTSIIEKYMICAWDAGNIDDRGHLVVKYPGTADGCTSSNTESCEKNREGIRNGNRKGPRNGNREGTRNGNREGTRNGNRERTPNGNREGTRNGNREGTRNGNREGTRNGNGEEDNAAKGLEHNDTMLNLGYGATDSEDKNGICQNDHGGPLVTWIGAHEFVIGVASVFRVSIDSDCVGPYLFTSTQCNGAFLTCIINPDGLQSHICNSLSADRGFEIIKRRISWMQHPDGPAENELESDLVERPQVPLHSYAFG